MARTSSSVRVLFAFSLVVFSCQAAAALNVFACTSEWGALAKELGGDKASVYNATTALQDPHRIEARPSLIARARSADLMVCTGAALEAGWAPLVQSQSGNPKIQPGRPGYFEAASVVPMLERPASLDRAHGDVHPAGNPHIHLDPRNIARVATALSARLVALDPPEAEHYRLRTKAFQDRWSQASVRWEAQAQPLKGLALVVYHKNLTYLIAWLGMRELGTLEPRPGIPPTTAHLAELLGRMKSDPAKAVVRSAYNDPRPGDWLAERAGIPSIHVAFTVGGTAEAKDLFSLFDDTLARLAAVAR
jgi:zinc/manganese transport system substrate-binding protein